MKNLKFLPLIALFCASLSGCDQYASDKLAAVQSGNKILKCKISKEYKVIDKSKVTGYIELNGNYVWEFTNGYAQNCIVE